MPLAHHAPWTLDRDGLFKAFRSTATGLASTEAVARRREHGLNEVAKDGDMPAWRIFMDQFTSPLVLILVLASVLSIALGEHAETVIILLMVFLGGMLGFVQEYRSEQALRQLRSKLGHTARVVRDGMNIEIDARDLVPGDLVELDLGTVVPADLRLISVDDLETDESALTGESVPVDKTMEPLYGDRPTPQDRINMAFMGTHVVQGSGIGLVVATGSASEMGRSASLLAKRTEDTGFQKGITDFGNFLLKTTIALCLIVAGMLGALRGDWPGSLLFAMALAVGLSPELLPVIVTMCLSRGALRMSHKQVLVKRLISIEDLGGADVLCTDKTGTLTVGTLRVREAISPDGRPDPTVLKLAASCVDLNGGGKASNPVDQAILDATGTGPARVYDKVAFDFKRRRMSCVVDDGIGGRMLVVKGATKEVIERCTRCDHAKLTAFADGYHDKGYRLVAVATRPIGTQDRYSPEDENDLELQGFILVSDAPKRTAKAALAALAKLHVRVLVLTGDNERVTRHVTEQLGFTVHGLVTGAELDGMDDAALEAAVEHANVFARITPSHKLRVIQALKRRGHAVAFMGDGVNDAPALREADAGISFQDATDVAKEAAGIILLEKHLGVLADGIREGRKTFVNTRTYIHATISSNFGNMLSVAGAALLLPFIPLLPSQILLLNLLSDIPMLAIPTDNVADEDIAHPLKWDIGQVSNFMYFFGTISSLADYAMFAVLLFAFRADPSFFRSGWFIGSMLTEVLVIFLLRTKHMSWSRRPSAALVGAACSMAVATIIITESALGRSFGLEPLGPMALGTIVVIVAGYGVLTEIGKLAYYRELRPTLATRSTST